MNKEAFAHFTEMSIMQDADDMASLERYFPNAYDTYLDMMDEMKEWLDGSRI